MERFPIFCSSSIKWQLSRSMKENREPYIHILLVTRQIVWIYKTKEKANIKETKRNWIHSYIVKKNDRKQILQ